MEQLCKFPLARQTPVILKPSRTICAFVLRKCNLLCDWSNLYKSNQTQLAQFRSRPVFRNKKVETTKFAGFTARCKRTVGTRVEITLRVAGEKRLLIFIAPFYFVM